MTSHIRLPLFPVFLNIKHRECRTSRVMKWSWNHISESQPPRSDGTIPMPPRPEYQSPLHTIFLKKLTSWLNVRFLKDSIWKKPKTIVSDISKSLHFIDQNSSAPLWMHEIIRIRTSVRTVVMIFFWEFGRREFFHRGNIPKSTQAVKSRIITENRRILLKIKFIKAQVKMISYFCHQ